MRKIHEVGSGDFIRVPPARLEEIESIYQPIGVRPLTAAPSVPVITTVSGKKFNPFQILGFFKRADLQY